MASLEFYELFKETQDQILLSEQERISLERKLYASSNNSSQRMQRLKMNHIKSQLENLEEYKKTRLEKNQKIRQRLMEVEANMRKMSYNTERLRLLKTEYEEAIERMYPQWKEKVIERTQLQRLRKAQMSRVTMDFEIPDQPVSQSVRVTDRERKMWTTMEDRLTNGSPNSSTQKNGSLPQPQGAFDTTNEPKPATSSSSRYHGAGDVFDHAGSEYQPSTSHIGYTSQYPGVSLPSPPMDNGSRENTPTRLEVPHASTTPIILPSPSRRRRELNRTPSPSPSELVRMSMSSTDAQPPVTQATVIRVVEPAIEVNHGRSTAKQVEPPIYAQVIKTPSAAVTGPIDSKPPIPKPDPLYATIDDLGLLVRGPPSQGQTSQVQAGQPQTVHKAPGSEAKTSTSSEARSQRTAVTIPSAEGASSDEDSDFDSLDLPDQTSNLPVCIDKSSLKVHNLGSSAQPTASVQDNHPVGLSSSVNHPITSTANPSQPIRASFEVTASSVTDDEQTNVNIRDTAEFQKILSGMGGGSAVLDDDEEDDDSLNEELKLNNEVHKQYQALHLNKTNTIPISGAAITTQDDDILTDDSQAGDDSDEDSQALEGMGYKPTTLSSGAQSASGVQGKVEGYTGTMSSGTKSASSFVDSLKSNASRVRADSLESKSDFQATNQPAPTSTIQPIEGDLSDSEFFG